MSSPSPRILVVDDEEQLVDLISYALSAAGLDVLTAGSGHMALAAVREHDIDLIVLDVLLPDTNGYDLCRWIRRHTQVPIVFLTVRSDQADVIAGLEAGGDDYLAKPFSIEELLLRINAMLRRAAPPNRSIRAGELTLQLDTHEAYLGEQLIELSPLEFRFLKFLATNRSRVISSTELVDEVWGVADLGAHDPLVKTAVYRLRQKLGDPDVTGVEIRNVRGIGYQLRTSPRPTD